MFTSRDEFARIALIWMHATSIQRVAIGLILARFGIKMDSRTDVQSWTNPVESYFSVVHITYLLLWVLKPKMGLGLANNPPPLLSICITLRPCSQLSQIPLHMVFPRSLGLAKGLLPLGSPLNTGKWSFCFLLFRRRDPAILNVWFFYSGTYIRIYITVS